MNIDTDAIRRLRDALLQGNDPHNTGSERIDNGTTTGSIEQAMIRRVQPFAETMYLVMMADGESAESERQTLAAALGILSDGTISRREIDLMLDRFAVAAASEGSDARLAQIGAQFGIDRDDRETAFTLAAVVALADDRVDVRENRLMESMQEYFGVSSRRAATLLESID